MAIMRSIRRSISYAWPWGVAKTLHARSAQGADHTLRRPLDSQRRSMASSMLDSHCVNASAEGKSTAYDNLNLNIKSKIAAEMKNCFPFQVIKDEPDDIWLETKLGKGEVMTIHASVKGEVSQRIMALRIVYFYKKPRGSTNFLAYECSVDHTQDIKFETEVTGNVRKLEEVRFHSLSDWSERAKTLWFVYLKSLGINPRLTDILWLKTFEEELSIFEAASHLIKVLKL